MLLIAKRIAPLTILVGLVMFAAVSSSSGASAQCTPVTAVFYESSDWARLVQGLGADSSSCAVYYVTIPALAADKTQLVASRAAQVRSYGPNFHALAEIHYSAWQGWVASTGNSWYQAGVEARRRMAAAGFDPSSGDTWVVNEFPSSVRTNAGAARQNVLDLVHGLYDGAGGPPLQGMVFVVGVGQNGLSFPSYKATLESWLQDAGFWAGMANYVSAFYQEAYGDVRNYAVAGVDPATRASLLGAYLQQLLSLADAPNAPATVSAARGYLQSAYGSLANASWGWTSAYGWTQVSSDLMADYVSAQTYAMRLTGESHIGFAWNPLNSTGLSPDDYTTQIGGVLARLAGSIHETDSGNPSQACEATGCSTTIEGAQTATGWDSFATWTPTTAAFTSTPVALTPASPSGPITIQLQTGGVATTLPFDSSVTVTSSSPTGSFSASPTGPFSATLTVPIPAGTNGATFYIQDASTGQPTLTTNVNGQIATQTESIAAVPAAAPPPAPPAMLTPILYTSVDNHLHFSFRIVDASGHPLQGHVRLAVLLGSTQISSALTSSESDGLVALTPFPQLALGCYSVRIDSIDVPGHTWTPPLTLAGDYCVKFLPLQVGAIAIGTKDRHLHVGVRIVNPDHRPVGAQVVLAVFRHGAEVASAEGRAASTGWFAVTLRGTKLGKGEACFSIKIRSLKAAGYKWNKFPSSRYACVR